MIDCKRNHKGEHLIGSGSLHTVTADVLRLVQMIHGSLLRSNPGAASQFRFMLSVGLFDPESPVFDPVPPSPDGDVVIVKETTIGGQDEPGNV